MLAKTWEAGRDKCFQYFPETLENDTLVVNDEDECGDSFKATVKLLECEHDAASRSIVRRLQVTVGEEEKTIWHILFSRWPDFSVPEGANRTALLELIKLSVTKNVEADRPRFVHCSAGVGRSGTFIALDYLLDELARGHLQTAPDDTDIIFDTVNRLREQRIMMVQSEAQYAFIYQIMLEKWNERYLYQDLSGAQSSRARLVHQSPTKEETKAAELASLAQEANAEMAQNVEKMEH
jgi:protein-tyrosine phosphatase